MHEITKLNHNVYDAIELLIDGDHDLNEIGYHLEKMNLYEYLYLLDKILLKVDIGGDLLKILFDFDYDCLSQDSLFESEAAVGGIHFKKFLSYPYDLIDQISHHNIFDRAFTLINMLNNSNIKLINRLVINVNKKIKILSGISKLIILTDQYSPEESFEYEAEDEWGNFIKQYYNHYNLVKKNAYDLICLPDFSGDPNFEYYFKNTLQREIIDCLNIITNLHSNIYDYNYLALLPCLKSQQEFKKIVSDNFLKKKSNSFDEKKMLIESIAEYSRRTNTDHYDFMLFRQVQTEKIMNDGTIRVECTTKALPTHYKEIIRWIQNEFKISLNDLRNKKLHSSKITLKNISPYKLHSFMCNLFCEKIYELTDADRGKLMTLFDNLFHWDKKFKIIPERHPGKFNFNNIKGTRLFVTILVLLDKYDRIVLKALNLKDLLIFHLKDPQINKKCCISDGIRKMVTEIRNEDEHILLNEVLSEKDLNSKHIFISKLS